MGQPNRFHKFVSIQQYCYWNVLIILTQFLKSISNGDTTIQIC